MDIELLSKMVRELILDNDSVALPGLGVFVAEMVPASFSDRGYTINPPYRKLVFRTRGAEDRLLVDLYASSNSVSADVATGAIGDFINNLKTVLFTHRTVVFPGLGKLRATREGHVFFISDEDLDIYPAGLGLEPVSLKTHAKPTSLDFSEFDVPVPDAAEETLPVAETPAEAVETPVADPVRRPRKRRPALAAVISVVCAAALVCGAFFALAKWCPDALDHILYTKEELEILNYGK